MQELFKGIFDTDTTIVISVEKFLLCIVIALLCGIILAGCYVIKTRHSSGFLATIAMLPAVVAVVIMMVNGNVGAGVAVAGAFSLVRFRSAPGTAKEIGAIFIAMGVGLVVGMGYIGYAILVSLIFGGVNLFYNLIGLKLKNKIDKYKVIRITIPEDLDYSDVFEPLLKEYTEESELIKVKTINMGSMFRLTYNIILKNNADEKELIDKLRQRNGNLEITISKQETNSAEL